MPRHKTDKGARGACVWCSDGVLFYISTHFRVPYLTSRSLSYLHMPAMLLARRIAQGSSGCALSLRSEGPDQFRM